MNLEDLGVRLTSSLRRRSWWSRVVLRRKPMSDEEFGSYLRALGEVSSYLRTRATP